MDFLTQIDSILPFSLPFSLPSPLRILLQWPLALSSIPRTPITADHHPSSSSFTSTCPNAQLSCHNTSAVPNTCCFNFPGGQFLQTQFWDTNPPNGPHNSWTLHGLWPDHCNGGFDQFCDSSRNYENITSILTALDATELLAYMNVYWRADRGPDERLWSHEWNKHGTCISTLERRCYDQERYRPEEEVRDYFEVAVGLFKTLDTYETLAAAGILPSEARTYTLTELHGPLEEKQGVPVTLRCHGNELDEVWYHFDVLGSVQTGKFVPAPPDGGRTNCPRQGVRYLPKDRDSRPTSTVVTGTSTATHIQPTSSSPAGPFRGKGNLKVILEGQAEGCLISNGMWYTSGTCAGFRVQDDARELGDDEHEHLFTLISSKGPCSIFEGTFQCAKKLPIQTVFSANGSRLAYQGSTNFSAEAKPGRFEKVAVHPEIDAGEGDMVIGIEWA